MDDDALDSAGRRVRRSRPGFAFTNASIGDSTTASGARDLNEEVDYLVQPAPSAAPPQPPSDVVAEEFNPATRMAAVRQRASQYEREYRLGLLHRMLMRNIPLDQIATDLGVSISQVYRDRDTLREKLRTESQGLDIDELIGDSKGYYDEAAALAMRAASMPNTPLPMKLAALRTGLAARNDMHRFFQTAGVYDVLRYRLSKDGDTVSDVRRLMERTDRMLNGEGEFSLKDADSDSASQEGIEL